mmetsp:Transcript_4297/g.4955  ORF Transcript_4297/g.4955 Transcript_4297/m.4955 type:complete len:244 (-) Transcript_4297:776-1507(-)|eukprot:CAMPEP_0197853080 /NCGR_PEP_ID=MMETSP1438-20131217/22037_1 /TAXON_ID=1461541 /ORGANISM="Pterosperma sp., Strain CCMP1384" /LENGTH=243 /DNA_ID=CAMNT_0043467363 /DNA_START=149 /DNA_END=880 /DNA_ORIENTATION=+
MLFLAIHTITDVTAKVPFAVMVIQDAIKTKSIPYTMKCRLIIPTSGQQSISMWEGDSLEEVEEYVNKLLQEWCETHLSPVVDEHMYGWDMDKAVSKTKESVETAVAKTTAAANVAAAQASAKLTEFDERLKISEKARGTASKAKESVNTIASKAMENETVAASVKRVSIGFDWFKDKVSERAKQVNSMVVDQVQKYNTEDEAAEAAATDTASNLDDVATPTDTTATAPPSDTTADTETSQQTS